MNNYSVPVNSLAFSPDGALLATGGGPWTGPNDTPGDFGPGEVNLWEVASQTRRAVYRGYTTTVSSVAFAPDGKLLATGGADVAWPDRSKPPLWRKGELRLWSISTGTLAATLAGHSDRIWQVTFSPDGKMLATASLDRTVKLWDLVGRTEIRSLTAHTQFVNCVAFAPNGKVLASGGADHLIKLWDVETGKELGTLQGHTASVQCLAIAPNAETLASGSQDGTIKLWNFHAGKEVATLRGHSHYVLSLSFSPNARVLASGSSDASVKFWDWKAARELATVRGHTGGKSSVAFSPNGKQLAWAAAGLPGEAGAVKILDVATELKAFSAAQ